MTCGRDAAVGSGAGDWMSARPVAQLAGISWGLVIAREESGLGDLRRGICSFHQHWILAH